MKKFMNDWLPGLVNVAILALSFYLALSGVPDAAIQGPGGWLIVRGITLVWAVVMAVGTYTNWVHFGPGLKQLVEDVKNAVTGNKVEGSTFERKFPLLGWVLAWVVFTQIMASFYVADWCVGGF